MHYSNDDVTNSNEILLLFSDGGGNYATHISTQMSVICLFLQLNLDMLIALQCCLSQSWVNPAEPVMSLLNLALQNCALERDPIETAEFEKILKKVTSINQLRTLSKQTKNLKEFSKSKESLKSLVNNRFESMASKKKSIVKKNQQQKMKYKSLRTQSWE